MRRSAAAALIALLVGSACSEAEPLTRSEYVAEADAICRDVARRWTQLEPPVAGDRESEAVFMELMVWDMKTGVALGHEVRDRVGALTPPPEMTGDARSFLTALDRLLDVAGEYAAAADSGDEAALERLDAERGDVEHQDVFERTARELGLKVCSQGLFLSSWRVGSTSGARNKYLDLEQPEP